MRKQEKTLEQRINNVIGQLQGITSMLKEDGDCSEILTQMKAVKSGVSAIMDKYIEEEMGKCLGRTKQTKESRKIKQLVAEVCKK